MPFWSRTKGSSASSSASSSYPAEPHQRSASRQAFAPRQPSPEPFPPNFSPAISRDPQQQQSFRHQPTLQQYRSVSPDIRLGHPSSQRGRDNEEDSKLPYHDNSSTASLGLREVDSKRGLREKLGLKSPSREALTDPPDDNPSSKTQIRRKLSTRIREQPAFHRLSGTDYSPQSEAQTPSRRELNLRDSKKESDSLRDLADFLRTTAPSSDPRRPLSVLGSAPGASQSHPVTELPPDPPQAGSISGEPRQVEFSIDSEYPVQVGEPKPLFRGQTEIIAAHQSKPIQYQAYHREPQPSESELATDNPRPPSSFSRPHSRQESENPADSTPRLSPKPDRAVEHLDLPRHIVHLAQPPAREKDTALFFTAGRGATDRVAMPSGLQPPRKGSTEPSEPPTPSMPGKGQQPTASPGPRRGSVSHLNDSSGRRTPPPSRTASDMSEQDVAQLMADYRELRDKYSKVKRYYFEKEAQVTQLQNAIAHQRLSQSRTSLDDGEYIARLTRLDGLIAQLAFGFRKDWKAIPSWLQTSVNKEALTTGKQEMTAVGRAFISQWLVEQVFERFFHPALSLATSQELKAIQLNLRKHSPALQMGEEEEALTTKIINWRLATVDGLQPILNAPEAAEQRQTLIEILNKELVATLHAHMNEPPPVGVEGGVNMIVELVVAILSHLPCESRDVNIEYYMPGTLVHPDIMKIESGIPPLGEPVAQPEPSEDESASRNAEGEEKETQEGQSEESEQPAKERGGKKGLFGGLMSKKSNASGPVKQGSQASASSNSLMQRPGSAGGATEEAPARVRMAVFLGLQIRDKMVLTKAPIFRL